MKKMIKPLEKKSDSVFILKLIFLVSLISTGVLFDRFFMRKKQDIPKVLGKTKNEKKIEDQAKDLIETSVKKVQNLGESVLGETTSFIQETTEKISSSVSDLIYENSFGKIVDQIDKLPQDQKQRIKEEICK